MIISFFSLTDFVTGNDCTGNENCIHVEDVNFDPKTQTLVLTEKKGKYIVEVVELPPQPETDQEKRKRVLDSFIATQDLSNFDWEGVELTTNEYSQLITARDFAGDNGSQVAMLTKALFKCMALFVQVGIPKETIQTVFSEEIQVANKVSDSRVALGLSPFELPL